IIQRMKQRGWPWLVLSILLWVPLIMPMNGLDWGIPFWPFQLLHFFLALYLLARTPLDLERRKPPTIVQGAIRSGAGALTLGVGTWIHLLCGGGAMWVDQKLFLVAGTFLGALFGPLALFEHRAASRPRTRSRDLAAALLTGWTAFLLLCLGWVQGYHARGVLDGKGLVAILDDVRGGLLWLVEDPWWTYRHFGWSAVPVAACLYARLAGWPVTRQQAFGLSVAGAAAAIFPASIFAISFGLIILPLAWPLVARVADLKKREAKSDEPQEEPRALRTFYVLAVVACGLSVVAGAGRIAWRAKRTAELDRNLARLVPEWKAREEAWALAIRVREAALAAITSEAHSPEIENMTASDALPKIEAWERSLSDIRTAGAADWSSIATVLSDIAAFRDEKRAAGGEVPGDNVILPGPAGKNVLGYRPGDEVGPLMDALRARQGEITMRNGWNLDEPVWRLGQLRKKLGLPPPR
ncbi:MAG TPA: hypothetical protein VFF73_26300, partial [Planctomycetota bacterium]|nr:hypothetical protein [Planctomycetota bacterium]